MLSITSPRISFYGPPLPYISSPRRAPPPSRPKPPLSLPNRYSVREQYLAGVRAPPLSCSKIPSPSDRRSPSRHHHPTSLYTAQLPDTFATAKASPERVAREAVNHRCSSQLRRHFQAKRWRYRGSNLVQRVFHAALFTVRLLVDAGDVILQTPANSPVSCRCSVPFFSV